MRGRDEIERDLIALGVDPLDLARLQVEVLLDIRDLLGQVMRPVDKEIAAWLDANVMRCGHGTIGITCHICAPSMVPR